MQREMLVVILGNISATKVIKIQFDQGTEGGCLFLQPCLFNTNCIPNPAAFVGITWIRLYVLSGKLQ